MKRRTASPARRRPKGDRARATRRLQAIRRLARELRREATAPVIERVSQIIETECHLALWVLGDPRGVVPEAEPRARR